MIGGAGAPAATPGAPALHAVSAPPRLTRVLALAPLSQRGLALGGALAVLLPYGVGSLGLGLWLAALIGGGIALMGLPRALGWSETALLRVSALALASGLVTMFALTSTMTQDLATGGQLRVAVVIAAIGSVLLLPLLGRLWPIQGMLPAPLASTVWATLVVFAGAALLLLGLTWPATTAGTPGVLVTLLALAAWGASYLIHLLQAGLGPRWQGRLIALRSGLVRLGALGFGWAVAILLVPRFEDAALRAAFATPLEGIAPMAGVLGGALLALAAAGVLLSLPGLLARWQLAGRIDAAANGESTWLAVVSLGVALVATSAAEALRLMVNLPGTDAGLDMRFGLTHEMVLVGGCAVLAHALVRIGVSRPAAQPGTALWLVLPTEGCSPGVLAAVRAVAQGWSAGPVTLLAPPAVALQIRGPHQCLARQAGTLTSLFSRSSTDIASWQRSVPVEAGRVGLPLRECYCSATAASAVVADLPADARVLVLADGPLAPGWEALLATLPPHSLRVWGAGRSMPPGGTRPFPEQDVAGWRELAFTSPRSRGELLAEFLSANRPREAGERRIVILHGDFDRETAERLAAALDSQTDAAGRSVMASTLAPPSSHNAPLRWSARTWGSVWALSFRAAQIGEFGRLGSLLMRVFIGAAASREPVRLDIMALEYGIGPDEKHLRGLERWADNVVSLRRFAPLHEASLLYAETAYTARLTLPPASALDDMLPMFAERILSESYDLVPEVIAHKTFAKPLKVFVSYAQKDSKHLDSLLDQLRTLEHEGLILVWHDRMLEPGRDGTKSMDAALANADIVLPLISADFLASDYLYGAELNAAIRLHEAKRARIVPVILRSCLWDDDSSPLAQFRVLPADGGPVVDSRYPEPRYHEVVIGLRSVAAEILAGAAPRMAAPDGAAPETSAQP